MKRYLIIVQHEVTVYAENENQAEKTVRNSEFMKGRTNLRCVYITEIIMPEQEKTVFFEDWRRASKS